MSSISYYSSDFDYAALASSAAPALAAAAAAAAAPTDAARSAACAAAQTRSGALRAWQRFHPAQQGRAYPSRAYLCAAFPLLRCADTAALAEMDAMLRDETAANKAALFEQDEADMAVLENH